MKNKTSFILVLFIFIFNLFSFSSVKKNIRLTALNSMERIFQHQEAYGPRKVEIKAAKNEYESFQVIVSALNENINVVNAEISDLVGEDGSVIEKENIKLFREEYVRVRRSSPRAELPPGLFPEPLVPFINPITGKPIEPFRRTRKRWGERTTMTGHPVFGIPFEVYKGQNQPIWVDIYVPKNIPAGVYKGKFSVTTNRDVSGEIPVILTVWDFVLPDGPTHRNHFGRFSSVARYFNIERDSEKFKEIEMRYCEEMASNRLNPPIPHSLLPEVNDDGSLNIIPERHKALKEFMKKLNVTDFDIPRAPFARLPRSTLRPDYKNISPSEREKAIKYYREYYNYLKENGWEKRAYLYMWDEPNLKENYEQVNVLGAVVREAVPELRILVVEPPKVQRPDWPDMDSVVDIWCPLWRNLDAQKDIINEKVAQGDEVWSYTALVQGPRESRELDLPYWQIDFPLSNYRIPTWINRRYNITGLLYWSTTTRVADPWLNPAFRNRYNGDGYLFYPGIPCGIDGAISSMRIKNVRDGMEDYEYFVILEKLAGKEIVNKIVKTVVPILYEFSEETDEILIAREKLAEEILKVK